MEHHAERSVEARDPLLGRVLEGRYHLLSVLGRGGMGVVYLADHVRLRRKVAIKMLQPQFTGSQEVVQRFHREARAAAAVGDEHIVDVTDMGHLDDGTYYIVLEYLEGIDLAELVASHGPLPVSRAATIVTQICGALTAVHAAGIVHRDLKPENVFLITRGGTLDFVKILDFGICKFHEDRPLTLTGIALGTPRFMAPEQLEARPDVDHRADVYAAGAILYFALTGRGPFEADSLPRLLMNVWSEPAPRLRDSCPTAPEALEQLVSRALQKQPRDRFQNSEALQCALSPFISNTDRANTRLSNPTQAVKQWALKSGIRASTAPSMLVPSLRRARRLRRGAAVVVLGCLVATALYLWLIRTAPAAIPKLRATTHADAPSSELRGAPNTTLQESESKPAEEGPLVSSPANVVSQPRSTRRNDSASIQTRAARRSRVSGEPTRHEEPAPTAPVSETRVSPPNGDQAAASEPQTAPTERGLRQDVPLPRALKHVFDR